MTAGTDQSRSILVVGGDNSAGLALVHAAVRAGYTVVATNEAGLAGVNHIRAAGAIPVSADITREGELRSAMRIANATVAINMAAQRVLQLPQVMVDYETLGQQVEDSAEALALAANQQGISRVIHLSAAYLYGDVEHVSVTEEARIERSNALFRSLARAEDAVLHGSSAGYVLRSGFIYGGWSAACATIAAELRQGNGIAQGHGNAAWIHEEDLAAVALRLAALEADEAHANLYNVADNTPASHHAFMSKFGAAFGTGVPAAMSGLAAQFRTSPLQRELLEQNTHIDCGKIKAALNWKPAYSQEAGLDRMTMIWRAEGATSAAGSSKELVKA